MGSNRVRHVGRLQVDIGNRRAPDLGSADLEHIFAELQRSRSVTPVLPIYNEAGQGIHLRW
jgi:hypothetical protein